MDWTKFSNHGESDNHAFEVICNLLFELWCKVYHTLEKKRENLRIAGYWVHCRRKFNDALEVMPKAYRKESIVHLFMKQIQAIYREEGKLSGLSSEVRLTQRQLVVKPLVDEKYLFFDKKIDSATHIYQM